MTKKNVEIFFPFERVEEREFYITEGLVLLEDRWKVRVVRYNRIGFLLTNYLITLLSIIEQYC